MFTTIFHSSFLQFSQVCADQRDQGPRDRWSSRLSGETGTDKEFEEKMGEALEAWGAAEDGVFVTTSYDPSSHFEDASTEVLALPWP